MHCEFLCLLPLFVTTISQLINLSYPIIETTPSERHWLIFPCQTITRRQLSSYTNVITSQMVRNVREIQVWCKYSDWAHCTFYELQCLKIHLRFVSKLVYKQFRTALITNKVLDQSFWIIFLIITKPLPLLIWVNFSMPPAF